MNYYAEQVLYINLGSSKHKSDSTLKCQKILEIDEEKINLDSSVPSTERKKTQLAKV